MKIHTHTYSHTCTNTPPDTNTHARVKGKGKAPQWPDLSPTQSRRKGCKVLPTLHFMATAFIEADGKSSPSPLYLRPNSRIQSTHSELNRLGGHQFEDRRDLNPGPLGLLSSVLTTGPHGQPRAGG